MPLSNQPVPVPGVPGLSMLNIDPDNAAEAYRQRVLAQLEATATEDERATVREQLSGACTTEIAAFEFAALLASEGRMPTTLRPCGVRHRAHGAHAAPAELAQGLDGIFGGQRPGASCLGPIRG